MHTQLAHFTVLQKLTQHCKATIPIKKKRISVYENAGTHQKRLSCWERLKAEEKGMTEDGWHHQLNGLEFEQAPGDGEGQGSLACCCPQGCKELDTTE